MSKLNQIIRNTERIPFSGCWVWTASLSNTGYGTVNDGGKIRSAHRFSYELHKGEIPDGLVIDHLCSVRCCVNPDHLEATTQAINIQRGHYNLKKTHCLNGHELAGDNLMPGQNGRNCRECNKKRAADYRARQKQVVR